MSWMCWWYHSRARSTSSRPCSRKSFSCSSSFMCFSCGTEHAEVSPPPHQDPVKPQQMVSSRSTEEYGYRQGGQPLSPQKTVEEQDDGCCLLLLWGKSSLVWENNRSRYGTVRPPPPSCSPLQKRVSLPRTYPGCSESRACSCSPDPPKAASIGRQHEHTRLSRAARS